MGGNYKRKSIVFFVFFLILFQSSESIARNIHIVPSIPIEEQLIYPNTKYFISCDIDLNGKTITLPESAVLVIKKGTVSNGVIQGNNSYVTLRKNSIENITIEQGVQSTSKKVKASFFKSNCNELLQTIVNICPPEGAIILDKKIEYSINTPIVVDKSLSIKGRKNVLKLKNPDNCAITAFEVKGVSHFYLDGLTIDGSWNPNRFHGAYTDQYLVYIDSVDSVSITKCVFRDAMVILPSWQVREPALISITNYCNVLFVGNKIINCYSDEGLAIRNDDVNKGTAVISNNYFDFAHTSSCVNAYYGRYIIKNNYFGTSRGSALNIFGYDSKVVGNTFMGSHYSCAIDLSENGYFNYPSHNIIIANNISYFCYDGFVGGTNIEDVEIKGNYYNANLVGQEALLDFYDAERGQPKRRRTTDKILAFNGSLKNINIQKNNFIGGNALLFLEDEAEIKDLNIKKNTIELSRNTTRSAIVFKSVDGLMIKKNVFKGAGCTPGYLKKPVFIATLPVGDEKRLISNVTIKGNEFYSFEDSCYVFAQSVYDRQSFNFPKLTNIDVSDNKSNTLSSLIFVDKDFSYHSNSSIKVYRNRFNDGYVYSNTSIETDMFEVAKDQKYSVSNNTATNIYQINTVVKIDGKNYYVVAGGKGSESGFVNDKGFLRSGQVILHELD